MGKKPQVRRAAAGKARERGAPKSGRAKGVEETPGARAQSTGQAVRGTKARGAAGPASGSPKGVRAGGAGARGPTAGHAPAAKPRPKKAGEAGVKPRGAGRAASAGRAPEHDDPRGVDALLEGLDHPLKPVVQQVRRLILGVGPGITEGVKWNSPSFYSGGWFATVNVRGKQGVLLVLHHGAAKRKGVESLGAIDDPDGLLHWHGPDRASVAIGSEAELRAMRAGLKRVVGRWVARHSALVGG